MLRSLIVWLAAALSVCAQALNATEATDSFVHPIAIDGKHFADSITGERFYIRGVDYQPGGASAYTRDSDPLSDAGVCARDVYLMQQLGVNTLRVYTVNPELDHSECMTMLAAANIYLLLDVNTPLASESINRYEPWTTYTPEYLRHVFSVVDQFSQYNNTLGFFIGNEIVNDERSAAVSPPYIRAVTRDVKDYMHQNCPRTIPIGYSAADDLRYRTQLASYLTCGDPDTAVDFYGVNTYQWCGQQTIKSSGYDTLIRDHEDFAFPVMFSEFGCNHIQPRVFQEIEAMFSPEMTPHFEGGLVYEFSQEANDYGLVSIDEGGDAWQREEFPTLRDQYLKAWNATSLVAETVNAGNSSSTRTTGSRASKAPECKSSYANLSGAGKSIPSSFGTDMIRYGVKTHRAAYNASMLSSMPVSPYKIYDSAGKEIVEPRITVVNNFSAHASEIAAKPRKATATAQSKDDATSEKSSKKKEKNEGYKKGPQNWSDTLKYFLIALTFHNLV